MRRTLALIALPLIAAGALLAGCGPNTSSGASAPNPAALADADGSGDGDGAAGDAFCTVLADRAKVIAELTVAVELENPADDATDEVDQIVAAQTAIAAAAPPQLHGDYEVVLAATRRMQADTVRGGGTAGAFTRAEQKDFFDDRAYTDAFVHTSAYGSRTCGQDLG